MINTAGSVGFDRSHTQYALTRSYARTGIGSGRFYLGRVVISFSSFGKALCEHFGLDVDVVRSDMQIHAAIDSAVSVKLEIMLTPDDLAGIARLMSGGVDGYGNPRRTGVQCNPTREMVSEAIRKNNAFLIDALQRSGVI
jgi:hypothetical protein